MGKARTLSSVIFAAGLALGSLGCQSTPLEKIRQYEKAGKYSEAIKYADDEAWSAEYRKDYETSRMLYEKAMQLCLQLGRPNLFRAANYADAAGRHEEAIAIYEKIGDFYFAGSCARRNGQEERAQELFEKNIKRLEETKFFRMAAEDAEELGQIERAIKDFKKGLAFKEAAECAMRAGRKEKAKELYEQGIIVHERLRDYIRAGNCAQAAGMNERARELYREGLEAYSNSDGQSPIYSYARDCAELLGLEDEVKRLEKEVEEHSENWGYNAQPLPCCFPFIEIEYRFDGLEKREARIEWYIEQMGLDKIVNGD